MCHLASDGKKNFVALCRYLPALSIRGRRLFRQCLFIRGVTRDATRDDTGRHKTRWRWDVWADGGGPARLDPGSSSSFLALPLLILLLLHLPLLVQA